MKTINQPPIFCDHCSSLALSELDVSYLCRRCLMDALKDSDDSNLLKRISPLCFEQDSVHYDAVQIS